MRKFSLGKAPFVRITDESNLSTTRIMMDVVIALVPIALFGWYMNGIFPYIRGVDKNIFHLLQPLINVLYGCATSIILEGLYFILFKNKRTFKDIKESLVLSYAVIPGLLLTLILPSRVPLYVILFGCFIANIVFKMLFGGFGHNIFNPALIGYAFCIATFGSVINDAFQAQINVFNDAFNIVTSATPLDNLASIAGGMNSFKVSYSQIVSIYGSLLNMFVGVTSGALGETSALLCIIAFFYLVIRKAINWRIPVIYVGTVFVLTWLVGIVNGIEGSFLGIWFPTFNILSGGLMFGAVFMATEPVTTPKTPNGKTIYAIILGVLTVLFRLVGSLPEGVATAILFTCLFSPIIDRFTAPLRGPIINFKIVLKYCFLIFIILIVAFYTIYKTLPSTMKKSSTVAINDINICEVNENIYWIGGDNNG